MSSTTTANPSVSPQGLYGSIDAGEPLVFDKEVSIGRSGLRQYSGFVLEDFSQNLRMPKGALLYREILDNSPLVGGIYRLIQLSMRQISVYFEPWKKDKDSAVAKEDQDRADRIQKALDDMSHSWAETMSEICSMIPYGFAPMEIVWKKCEGWQRDGSRSNFTDGYLMPRKISLRSQDSLFRWAFDDDGGVQAMVQLPPPDFQTRIIPIEKLLLFRPEVEKDNPEGKSVLRSAVQAWNFVKNLSTFEAIKGERDATGVPYAKIPGRNITGNTSLFQVYKKLTTNLRVDDQSGFVIPSDVFPGTNIPQVEVGLLGANISKGANFDYNQVITRWESRMAMSMLADVAMMGHDKVGSFALSQDKRSMLADGLSAWLDAIVGVINRHLIPRIYEYNGWPMDKLCTMGHGDVQARDVDSLADAAQKLSMAGMPLFPDPQLENHIRDEFGWPERTEESGIGGKNDPALVQQQLDMGDQRMQMMAQGQNQPGKDSQFAAKPKEKPTKPGDKTEKAYDTRTRQGRFDSRSGNLLNAFDKLRNRQRIGTGDQISHGLPVTETAPYDTTADWTDEINSAPIERIDLSNVVATQMGVRRDHVRSFLENPGIVQPGQKNLSGALEDRPVVVRVGKTNYLHDGHHRVARALLMGQSDILARVIETEPQVTAPTSGDTFNPTLEKSEDVDTKRIVDAIEKLQPQAPVVNVMVASDKVAEYVARPIDVHVAAPNVTVEAAQISVAAPSVNVEQPAITIEQPSITVEAPSVTVPTTVNVQPADVFVKDAPKPQEYEMVPERDAEGRIVKVVRRAVSE